MTKEQLNDLRVYFTPKYVAMLLGRQVAMVERECKDEKDFPLLATLCNPETNNQAYFYWLNKALAKGSEDLVEVSAYLQKQDKQPSNITDPAGQYFVGYYKQQSDDQRAESKE